MPAPSDAEQISFIRHLQRLLNEGSFVATYKYALLLALADLSVERGDDSGAPMILPADIIAEKLIAYYWRQTAPYSSRGGQPRTLKQSTGDRTAILQAIEAARMMFGDSLQSAKRDHAAWKKLVAEVSSTLKKMPLWKLQTIGPGMTFEFLYANQKGSHHIELKPGVAYCFRRFHQLINDLVRADWARFIRSLRENQEILAEPKDLDVFLFGSEREDLGKYRPVLASFQKGACFYCEAPLRSPGDVDHFVPWARYPVDLAHNFVLAHAECNGAKKSRLAAYDHLKRWCARNVELGDELTRMFDRQRVVHDLNASFRITRWAYEQTTATGGLVWVAERRLVPLDAAWRHLPGLAA